MDITQKWCAREGISLVVRSHEYNPSGFLVMHGGRLITVFSARNYMDTALNDSALLLLTYDDTQALRVRIKTLSKRANTSVEPVIEQFGTLKPASALLDAIVVKPLTEEDMLRGDSFEGIVESEMDGSAHSDVSVSRDGTITGQRQSSVEEGQERRRKKNSGFVSAMRRRISRTFTWSKEAGADS
jgi:hypothetical protein